MIEENENKQPCVVVANQEQQYSVWPEGCDIPSGWKSLGKAGPRNECLAFIQKLWTDIRPLSVRREEDELTSARRGSEVPS